ncbi:MAG TPA: 4'-phosphopantetheinyl transferase superfamily protein [Gammaproteobacteria bacterium]
MTGAARAIHIHYTDRRALPDEVVDAFVTAEDRQRVSAEMHARRRSEFLAGRALLRHALACHTGRHASSLRIRVTTDGKPECVDGPAISVAHSSDLVCCAIAERGSIGVDVETGRRRLGVAALAQRYFTSAEARWVDAEPEQRFRMLWVLKEAYLKALGVGLAGGLGTLECRIEPPVIEPRVARGGDAPRLSLWAGADCHLAVASLGVPPSELAIKRWAPAGEPDAFGPLAMVARTE